MNTFLRVTAIPICTVLAACAGQAAPTFSPSVVTASHAVAPAQSLKTPALLTVEARGNLAYWEVGRGYKAPAILTHLNVGRGAGIAANGDQLAIANQQGDSGSTFLYNLTTHKSSQLPDASGIPLDIAMGRDTSLYVLNDAKPPNALWYPPKSTNPTTLTCAPLLLGENIAVDNEGDVFVGGLGHKESGVFEIPNGPNGPQSQKCARLPLVYTRLPSGLAVDPKTDDLIVLDDPSQCAGGYEGRMIVYSKPYDTKHVRYYHILGGNCAGGIRLNADSSVIFYGDQGIAGGSNFIRSSTYPDGKPLAGYFDGAPLGFIPLPNELPN